MNADTFLLLYFREQLILFAEDGVVVAHVAHISVI